MVGIPWDKDLEYRVTFTNRQKHKLLTYRYPAHSQADWLDHNKDIMQVTVMYKL